jgi:hypothetical protein
MKTKFKYETPMLVDLSAESALGATCNSWGGDATDWMCVQGSCPQSCDCKTGGSAQACMTGSGACHANDPCWACCTNGTGVSAPGYTCNCVYGLAAVWDCNAYGGNASQDCGMGANYGQCP